MRASPIIKIFVLSVLFVFLSSCSSSKSRVGGVLSLDTDIKITFEVDSDINPDEKNKPSPLFVRMYELKSETLFNKVDFVGLYEKDEALLGADLIRKQELKRIAPGEDHIERFVADKETHYIAIYAEFFNYKDAKYKIIFPVTTNNIFRNSVRVRITENNITLLQ